MFKPTIHKNLGYGIKLIGEGNIRRPSPFVGLSFTSSGILRNIVKIKGDPLSVGTIELDGQVILAAENFYNILYTEQGILIFGRMLLGEPDGPKHEVSYKKGDILCYLSCDEWMVDKAPWSGAQSNIMKVEIIDAIIEPKITIKNNDGREFCAWCGQPTKEVNTGFSYFDVCRSCGR